MLLFLTPQRARRPCANVDTLPVVAVGGGVRVIVVALYDSVVLGAVVVVVACSSITAAIVFVFANMFPVFVTVFIPVCSCRFSCLCGKNFMFFLLFYPLLVGSLLD